MVNILKTDSYECPACKYTWSVNEPELPQAPQQQPAEAAAASEPPATVIETPPANTQGSSLKAPQAPPKTPETFNLDDVPRPPLEGQK